MEKWWREEILRRVVHNTGLLGSGEAVGAALQLAGLVITGRLLGPIAFGGLILVRSYAQSAGRLARFQSWQTLIHFGTALADADDRDGFRDLVAFTILADAATGLIATILAAALAPVIGPALGIVSTTTALTQRYCLTILRMASATPTGVLRIFDRLDLLSWHAVLTLSIRLTGGGGGALLSAPLWAMVVAWLASDVLGESYLWLESWREMRRRGFTCRPLPSARRALAENKGLLRFSLASNATATLSHSLAPLFTLMVGALLGSVAAGLYRIAQVVLNVVAAPAELAMRSFFPEVTRLRGNDDPRFATIIRKVVLISAWLGFSLGIVVALAGPALVVAAMGASYAEVGTTLQIVALGFAPVLAVFPVEAALLATGRAGSVLLARAVSAAVAFSAAALLAGPLGLPGIGLAAVFGFFAACGAMLAAARSS